MSYKVGVIAGTPVDTQMGIDFLISKGLETQGYPISKTPKDQSRLQLLEREVLYEKVVRNILFAKEQGIKKIFVYCNSLSAAVDMDALARETNMHIVTPFVAYSHIGKSFRRLLVIAANGNSCAKIEAVLEKANKEIKVFSISALPLVEEIEKGLPEEVIYEKLALGNILRWAEGLSIQGIVLGCTHFPYIGKILGKKTRIPIIDPAEKMFEMLRE